jgi:hypothetical protein
VEANPLRKGSVGRWLAIEIIECLHSIPDIENAEGREDEGTWEVFSGLKSREDHIREMGEGNRRREVGWGCKKR